MQILAQRILPKVCELYAEALSGDFIMQSSSNQFHKLVINWALNFEVIELFDNCFPESYVDQ